MVEHSPKILCKQKSHQFLQDLEVKKPQCIQRHVLSKWKMVNCLSNASKIKISTHMHVKQKSVCHASAMGCGMG